MLSAPAPTDVRLSNSQLTAAIRSYMDALNRGAPDDELNALASAWAQEMHRRWPHVFRAPDTVNGGGGLRLRR